ncbi:NAD(P)/FAD-dependent oxidoreductase [Occultella gossypii]|uniref:NAD(P)/FAD-dependent oxidoreductase n=1 Tax=Occultella gossypii TaxID=2800820 RepID=A0ABS7S7G1_9MICO|nr:NAD(P)/FAD-dependent oxidoreductase [Occultella gossypii]MBZ2196296.1 NAD(P)/FAD-dependent oxidoreductase [Occultella gossypii]
MSQSRTDILVVGGGPVGLAVGIEARLAGREVVVVEPRTAPVDKACGEGLMPGALAGLHRLGVDPTGHVLTGISYRDGRRHADHLFATGSGRGVRRTTLHAALYARSIDLGVEHVRARADRISQSPDGVQAAGIAARFLIACDGLHSTTRRAAGLAVASGGGRERRRFGLRRHFRVAAWTDLVEVHWGAEVEAYVTPVADDAVGVALLGPAGVDYTDALATFPEISDRLRDAEPLGPVRGAGPLRQRSRRRVAGRIRLVGDASGYVDALTGEGLSVGLAQARAAVATLDDGPEAYERAWARATRDYRLLTSGLVRWAMSPGRAAIVPVAARVPPLFGAIVERLAR